MRKTFLFSLSFRVPVIDTYKTLCDKLKQAIKWFHQTQTAKFLLKIDDDSFVRVEKLAQWLLQTSTARYLYMGNIAVRPAVSYGKWADPEYKKDTNNKHYPRYANGASGYVTNRNVTEILINQEWENLKCYANEDASFGLWMHQLVNVNGRQLVFKDVRRKQFTWSGLGNCKNTHHLVIGHNLTPHSLMTCYRKMMLSIYKERADVLPERKSYPDSTQPIKNILKGFKLSKNAEA